MSPAPQTRGLRQLSVFDVPEHVLGGLELVWVGDGGVAEAVRLPLPLPTPLSVDSVAAHVELQELAVAGGTTCLACGVDLANDASTRRAHYKSDWHLFNLKRQQRGAQPVTELQFEQEADRDDESISGSESEEEAPLEPIAEDAASLYLNTRLAQIYATLPLLDNQCFGVYKAVFSQRELEAPLATLLSWRTQLHASAKTAPQFLAVIMIGGGHFSGAVIKHSRKTGPGLSLEQGVEVVALKLFHRYTVRRRQGGSQGASDNARGKANSAGSSMRRQMEIMLEQEVQQLLRSWKEPYLDQCVGIYVRASGVTLWKVLKFEGLPIDPSDQRVRTIPFTTKRATLLEVRRVWVRLTTLSVQALPRGDSRDRERAERQQQALANSRAAPVAVAVAPLLQGAIHTKELVGFVRKSKVPPLVAYLKKHKLAVDMPLEPVEEYATVPTLLFYAAANHSPRVVQTLVATLGADPTATNSVGQTPYELAGADSRKAFRVARHGLGEEAWDWKAAKVGLAKSREQFDSEAADAKAQEEREKQEAIERLRAVDLDEESRAVKEARRKHMPGRGYVVGEPTQEQRLGELSAEQRQRVMREQRARAAEARMARQT